MSVRGAGPQAFLLKCEEDVVFFPGATQREAALVIYPLGVVHFAPFYGGLFGVVEFVHVVPLLIH